MDKVNQKMRKFNLRGVLIGLRATALGNSPHKLDSTGIEESLRSEHFQVAKVRRLVCSANRFVRLGLKTKLIKEIDVSTSVRGLRQKKLVLHNPMVQNPADRGVLNMGLCSTSFF